MKAKFNISKNLQVKAFQRLETTDDSANLDLDIDFAGPYIIDMEVNFLLSPEKQYDIIEIVDEVNNTVTIWFNDKLCIPNFPKERVLLI